MLQGIVFLLPTTASNFRIIEGRSIVEMRTHEKRSIHGRSSEEIRANLICLSLRGEHGTSFLGVEFWP